MQKLDHPNTVRYLGAKRQGDCLNIFMEYVDGGTVASMLRTKGPFDEGTVRRYTHQLLQGLEYLHSKKIAHRDLKGDNLFLDSKDNLKVGDFGTSKELQTMRVTDSVAGTPNFMAPEVIACSGHSFQADIWSVGCCVIQMLTGKPPFSNLDNHMAVMFAVMKGQIEQQIPKNISPEMRDFISLCTQKDPNERATTKRLLEHCWIKNETLPCAQISRPLPEGGAPQDAIHRQAGGQSAGSRAARGKVENSPIVVQMPRKTPNYRSMVLLRNVVDFARIMS